MTISLVLVSHSVLLAQGVAQLAGQMAPDVPVVLAAGMPDGSLGTSFDIVNTAIESALASSDGVVIFADLGSAVLTADMAIELGDGWAGSVMLARAPFVEGAVAAAVCAQQDHVLVQAVVDAAMQAGRVLGVLGSPAQVRPQSADASQPCPQAAVVGESVESAGLEGLMDIDRSLEEDGCQGLVVYADPVPAAGIGTGDHAAASAGTSAHASPGTSAHALPGAPVGASDMGQKAPEQASAHVVVRNPLGLHARPAAVLARAVAQSGVAVTIDGVDAASVLMLLTLGATGGRELHVTGTGTGAQAAVDAVVAMIESGFGEVE